MMKVFDLFLFALLGHGSLATPTSNYHDISLRGSTLDISSNERQSESASKIIDTHTLSSFTDINEDHVPQVVYALAKKFTPFHEIYRSAEQKKIKKDDTEEKTIDVATKHTVHGSNKLGPGLSDHSKNKREGPTSSTTTRTLRYTSKYRETVDNEPYHISSNKSSKETKKSYTRSSPFSKAYKIVLANFEDCEVQCSEDSLLAPRTPADFDSRMEDLTTRSAKYSKSGKSQTSDRHNACCEGGISFLKFHLQNFEPGSLTLDPNLLSGIGSVDTSCQTDKSIKSGKYIDKGTKSGKNAKSSKSAKVQPFFINCNDDCLTENIQCQKIMRNISVATNESICLSSVDEETRRVLFGQEMSHSVPLYFSSDSDATLSYTSLHTSCSVPLYPSYAQKLSDICDKPSDPVKITEVEKNETSMIVFEDGFSANFYTSYNRHKDSFNQTFSYNFLDCGACQCENAIVSMIPTGFPSQVPSKSPSLPPVQTPAPTPTPTPSSSPSSSPSLSPLNLPMPSNLPSNLPSPSPTPSPSIQSVSPSLLPSSIPTPSPLASVDCVSLCKDWIETSCIFNETLTGENGSCFDLPTDDDSLYGRRNMLTVENAPMQNYFSEDYFDYHLKMVSVYEKLMSLQLSK